MNVSTSPTLRGDPRRYSRDALIDVLVQAGAVVRGNRIRCPFHDDRNPSGSLYCKDSVWRYKCFPCGVHGDYFDIAKLTGWKTQVNHSDPLPERRGDEKPEFPTYDQLLDANPYLRRGDQHKYRDANGRHVQTKFRMRRENGGKCCPYASISPSGMWRLCALPKPRPLYNLPAVLKSRFTVITEGEKCADRLTNIGMVATTSGGYQSAGDVDWSPLAGRIAVIWPDADAEINGDAPYPPGTQYMADVIAHLIVLTPKVDIRVVDFQELGFPHKYDVADVLDDDHDGYASQFAREIIYGAPEVNS